MSDQFRIKSVDEIKDLFKELHSKFEEYKVILLEGDMGAGKTTFIKAYTQYREIVDVPSSPTFGLVNEYRDSENNIMYHFDLYRVEDEEELYDIGFEEYLDSGNLCFIEWPGIAENFIPIKHILLNLLIEANEDRTINVSYQPN